MRSLFENLYPDEEADNSYDILYEALYGKGYRGIIFDIDNTLVPHGAPATHEAVRLFERIHAAGFDTLLLSNNKEERVKPFADAVKAQYIFKAHKPARAGYLQAMKQMNTDPGTTLFIGDQIFTDAWGAKKAGIRTILVKPIHPKEEIQIVLKRRLEAIVLFFYHRRKGSER